MTRYQKHTRIGRTITKFGVETIFVMANSILAFISEIQAFFIKYLWSDDKVSKTYNEGSYNNEIRYGDYFSDGLFNSGIYFWNSRIIH